MKIAVGSKNPGKIEAVKQAFEKVWPNEKWEIVGFDVDSGVPSQPMGDEESIKGAKNRAQAAIKQAKTDYGVGLEGGIQENSAGFFDCGWMAVVNKKGEWGIGSSAKVFVPPKMMEYIKSGKELGEVCDIVFGTSNSKHGTGHFGLMTKDAITRVSGYKNGVIMALARFLHPQLY